jgi:hypothetical protein
MTKTDYLVWIGALVLYNLYATVLVVRAEVYERGQKIRQIVIIWLLPLVGAVLVRLALNAAERTPKPVDRAFIPQEPNAETDARNIPGPDAHS